MAPRRRVFAELVPLVDLARGPALELLARFRVAPIVAVRPDDARDVVAAVVARARAADLPVALWPMIDDVDGRWCNAASAPPFVAFVDGLASDLAVRGALPDEVLFDLEPAFAAVKGAFSGGARGALSALASPAPIEPAAREIAAAASRLEALGVAVVAAVAPPVLLDGHAGRACERLLGTPVSDPAPHWARVSAMLYSSILEGWSRGFVDRAAARALVGWGCAATRARFGAERAGACLGAVGVGALGDEPVYRSPDELADDVAIARACGVDDLALFELAGVLAKARTEGPAAPERWLAAFVETPAGAAPPPLPRAARAALAGLTIALSAAK